MPWSEPLSSYIWIFNVGRGSCAFIRTPLNQGILIDCGSSEDFLPLKFLKEHITPRLDNYEGYKIAQAIISHPHVDHFTNIFSLFPSGNESKDKNLYPALLTCPNDKEEEGGKEALNWDRIENPKSSDELVAKYRESYKDRRLPLQTVLYKSNRNVPNLEYGIFYLRPPVCADLYPGDDLKYANATSIMLFLRYGSHSILFTGDIPPEAMESLLNEEEGSERRYTKFDNPIIQKQKGWHIKTSDGQPTLKQLLKQYGLTVLVAPHHGLESGFSKDLYGTIKDGKPKLVVISEKRHLNPQAGQVCQTYQSEEGASGLKVFIENREEKAYSLTTRNGHHILIIFSGTGQPKIYAEKDPLKLLQH